MSYIKLKEEIFEIDGMYKVKGYSFGDYWNGFECPFFTEDVATDIVEETLDADLTQDYFLSYEYDEEKDMFILETRNADLEFEAIYIETEAGKRIALYPIGSWIWCWSKSEKQPDNPNVIKARRL